MPQRDTIISIPLCSTSQFRAKSSPKAPVYGKNFFENCSECKSWAKKDETVFDNDPPQHFDGLTVTYQLLNKDSIPMKSFKQGEDIIFSLIIKNNRDTTVSLPLIDSIGINVPPVSERNVPPSAERNVPLVSD